MTETAVRGWTDTNQHDPGITLLELLVWLACAFLFALAVSEYVRRRRRRARSRPVSVG